MWTKAHALRLEPFRIDSEIYVLGSKTVAVFFCKLPSKNRPGIPVEFRVTHNSGVRWNDRSRVRSPVEFRVPVSGTRNSRVQWNARSGVRSPVEFHLRGTRNSGCRWNARSGILESSELPGKWNLGFQVRLRWLDRIFEWRYLSTLSNLYATVNNKAEKRSIQLY